MCLSPPTLVGLSHLYSFPNDFLKQENGEDATTFKVTFRSKEYRAQKKHTFNFFAALRGAQRIQKAGSGIRATALELHQLWKHIYSCSGCVCETLHEQHICYTVLTQQVSNTSACPEAVANRVGNPKTIPWSARDKTTTTKNTKKKGSSSSWSCSSCFGSVFGIQAIQNSHYSLRISVHNICRYTNQRQQNQMGSISNPWNRMRLHLPKTVSQISPFIM